MESSDEHRLINVVSPCTLDRLVEHLLTQSSGFKLESLPPTSAGATFHSYRDYLVLQQLVGNICPRMTRVGSTGRGFLSNPLEIGQELRNVCCESRHADVSQVVGRHAVSKGRVVMETHAATLIID